MYYSTSKFPSDVSKLFKPRPPLQYKRPVDYPPEKRCTNPKITGVSQLLGSPLKDYLNQFSNGSDNKYLSEYENAVNFKITQLQSLDEKFEDWNPNEDPNIKDTDPYRTIFVGRLPYQVSEIELQKEFSRFGEIERVRVVRDKTTNKSKGYAFVVFTNPQSSKIACKEIGVHRGLELGGRTCIVDIERGRTVKYFKPRRLGGGLGGRGYTKKDNMAQFMPATSERPFRRSTVERGPIVNQPIKRYPPRPVYTGPSRFSRAPVAESAPAIASNRFDPNPAQDVSSTKSSYRSRNARAQESRHAERSEEPDY